MNSIQNEWEIPGFPIPSLQLVLHGALLKVPTVILRGFYHPTQTAITSNHEKNKLSYNFGSDELRKGNAKLSEK